MILYNKFKMLLLRRLYLYRLGLLFDPLILWCPEGLFLLWCLLCLVYPEWYKMLEQIQIWCLYQVFGNVSQLTGLPGSPEGPVTPGGPMRVRLLIGHPCAHLVRIDAAYWEIWAVTTPWHSCSICSSVSPGPCKLYKHDSRMKSKPICIQAKAIVKVLGKV